MLQKMAQILNSVGKSIKLNENACLEITEKDQKANQAPSHLVNSMGNIFFNFRPPIDQKETPR